MSETIRELRAQRELIRKHLNWLDAQIAQAEQATAETGSHLPSHSDGTAAKAIDSQGEGTAVADLDDPTSAESHFDVDAQLMRYSSAPDIQSIRIGCSVLFAAATLLFLFLLFGLPYLLD